MKKIVSLLLVALLVIGLFPVSATHVHAAEAQYVKVTSAPTDWSGDYLIVYEDGSLVLDGSLTTVDAVSNYQSVTISDGAISGADAYKVTIAAVDGGYSIKSASGYYIGQTTNGNGLKSSTSTVYTNTISLNDDGTVNIVSSGAYLRYNAASNQARFRYYKSSSYTNQKAICLYKLDDAVACDHANTTIETVAATCTETGATNTVCSDCGETVSSEEIPALGHTEVTDAAVDATCTATGLTEGSHCSVCEEVIVAQEEVAMIDHTYENGACTVCGAEDPAVCAHTNTTVETVAATCTEAGATNTVCSDCGETVSSEEIPALGHTEVTDAAVDATCTATGLTEGSHCSVCGEVTVAQTVTDLIAHAYENGTCTVCGALGVITPETPESGNYVLVTDINEILAGGKFVIVANYEGVNYAMSVATSGKPAAVEVAVSNNMVAYTEGTTPVWTIGKYGDNIALVNGKEYLGYGTSGTNFATKTEPYAWVVAAGENNTFTITSFAVTTRAIIYRNTGVFAPYATSNLSESGYCGYLNLYKLTEGEVEVITSTVSIKENNTDVSSEEVAVGSTITLPEATVAAPEGYTFAGWVECIVTDTAIAPETIYAAGSTYTVNDAVTFYALYSCSKTVEDGTVYQQVTSADTLAAGDKLVIAAADSDVAMSTTQNSNNRGQAAVTKSESQITFDSDVQVLTLEAGIVDGTLAFNTGSGYLYAASSSKNQMKTEDTLDENGSWLITVAEDGTASVVAQGTNTRNVMQYNQSSSIFACYASASQKAIVLYKATMGAATVTTYTTCGHENGIVTDAAVEVTCTEDGKTEGSHCELCGMVFVAQEVIEATGHSYGEVVVTTPATLQTTGEGVKTCASCGDELTITISAQQGDVEKWSLTLGSDLTVNFEIYINSYIKDTAAVNITVGDKTYSYAASEAPYGEGYNCYLFSASFAAAQMNETITVQIVNGEDVSLTKEYTVLAYAETILADETMSQYHDLVKEMLNYGAAAQTYFDHNADNLVNSAITDTTNVGDVEIPESTTDLSATGIIDGVSFYAASLAYRNKVALRFYFAADSIEGLTFAVNGTECEAVPYNGYYVVEVADILPQDLENQYTVTVTNGTDTITVVYGPMNYIVRMNAKGSDTLKALLKAMYNYHLAAKAYVTSAAA